VLTVKNKADYLDSVVNAKRYTEEIVVMKDRLKVEFRSMYESEQAAISNVVSRKIQNRELISDKEINDFVFAARTLVTVASVNGGKCREIGEICASSNGTNKTVFYVRESDGNYTAPAWLEELDKWRTQPVQRYVLILSAYAMFMRKFQALIDGMPIDVF
jgi:hypothetical protein